MYDIIFLGNRSHDSFTKLRKKFPMSKQATSFEEAQKKSFTKFFWLVFPDLVLEDSFKFDYEATEWDVDYVHVFKNRDTYDGVCLCSKTVKVSNREITNRFFINKKEIDIIASTPLPYDKFNIHTYEDYVNAAEQSTTNMFWAVFADLEVNPEFKFDFYVPAYNHHIVHVFKNGELYDGVCLFSKASVVSKREFEYRFFTVKKEIDIQSSITAKVDYDIVFISYNEPNADENFKLLQSRFPRVKRVHGVKGIHQAHLEAAKLCTTDMFWVVDGDAIVVDSFNFDHRVSALNKTTVHVWRSQNPVNGLEYGYGGVKLLPRNLTLMMDTSSTDMTTSISTKFKAMPDVSNITSFNTDPFSTWRSAFRECCKLASKTISGQVDVETTARLKVWCAVDNGSLFGEYAIKGALAGRAYGEKNAANPAALSLINNFDWLNEQFALDR